MINDGDGRNKYLDVNPKENTINEHYVGNLYTKLLPEYGNYHVSLCVGRFKDFLKQKNLMIYRMLLFF